MPNFTPRYGQTLQTSGGPSTRNLSLLHNGFTGLPETLFDSNSSTKDPKSPGANVSLIGCLRGGKVHQRVTIS